MNISFDDLIPTPEGDAGGEAASAVAPLAGGRAPREAREAEPTEAQKKAAAEEWARGVRARQTGLGAYGETFGRGVARAVPFSHQIGSAFDYALGTGVGEGQSSYEDTLRRQRAMSTVDDETRFKTGLAGQLVGGAALPTAGLAAQGVKGAAALGASYGALHGAAEGESLPDAAGKALVGGGLGGAFGAGVGAAAPYVAQAAGRVAEPVKQGLGVLYERLAPKAPDAAMAAAAAAAKTGRDEIADAAARIGVDVPRFIASESRPVQQAAHVARNIPIAGKPVIEATRKLANDLGEAAAQRATNLGALSQHEAGAAARNAFDAWNVAQKQRIGAAYDAVDDLVDPAVTVPLRSTAALVAELAAARDAAAMNPTGGAAALVMPAISREEGLSYQGAKLLRTRLGEALDNPASLETANISQGELRRIYGALTDDIKSIVDAAGGPAAREALATANAMNASVSTLRERLQPLLAGASDESVIAKLASAARSTGRPDIELLTEAQRAISKSEGAWDAISGSVLASLGRDAEGVFSPQRFVTAYGKITPQAKAVLFPGQVGKDLDDIARVASRSAETYRQFGNPSGTGQTVAGAAGAMGLSTDPISTLTSLGGAALVARVLSRPAAISKAAQWAKAAEAAAAAAANGQPVSQKALTAKIIDFAKAAELPPDFVREAALRAAGAQAARIGAGPPPALPKVAGAEGGESDDNPSFAGTFGRAVKLGAQRAAHEVAQTATASVKGLEGVKDWQEPKDPAIDRISEQGWMSGITDPRWYAAKVGEGIGGSSPSIAGGVVGAGVGSAVAPGVGTVVGGAGGAAMMAAVQALAPAYARARAAGMPHDAAVNVAMGETAISGTAGAAGAVAPFFRVAKGPISNLLAQLFVVQPGIGSAEQVARSAVSGRGITAEELIGGYVSNAGAGAAMHGGMSAAHRAFGRGNPPTPPPPPSSVPPGPRPGNPPTPAAQPSPPSPNPAARAAGVAAIDGALRAHEAGARAVADALAPPPLSSSGAASGAMAAGVRPPATVQATPNTFAAAIRQQAASSQVPGYDPRQVRPPAERGQPAGVFTFDAAALATDAQRFQYKADGDGQGVLSGGEGLKSVSKWDRTKAGQILVYEDHDGQTYVVDGHQRAGLARRIKDADPQAQTPITGLLLRSRDGITATQARTIAALKNIAEGSGTLIDAAKIFRDQPGALDDGSLARGRERIQDIEGLARLGPEAFGMVVNDVVPPVYGSLVGRIIPSDTARQDAAMRLLAKADPSTADEARALVRQVAQEDVTTTQEGDLFGGRDIAESLVLEKARVLAQAQRALGRERSTFGTLVKDATRIEGAGNTLAPDANAARRAEAEALATRIDAEAFRKGIVSDALSRAAEGHKAGWSARDAAERFVSAVRSGDVSSLAVDRPGSGGGERGAEAARPPRPVRDEQPAGEVAPLKAPAIEATPAGPQTVIPGAEKAPGAKFAQIGADAPLKPTAPQKDTDGLPLMNDSGKQGDLVDAIKNAPPLADDQSGGAKPGIETRVVEKDGATETIKLLPPGTIRGGGALDLRMWRVDERGVKGSVVTPLKVTRFDTEAEAREFFNARIKHYENYEKPAKQPERMLIGKNRDGHPLLQDDRGVRSYVVDGLRVTESIKLGPDGEPMVDEKTRHPDYLLPDEIEDASAGNGKDDNPPEMGKNGGKNSGADFSPPKTAEKPPAADAEPANPATGTKSDAVASPSAEPQPVAWADAKPGDKLASGETLIARGIRVKREAQEMAAKAPPGRVRGVIGDGVGRWAVTERDGVTGAKAWEARRADLVEQGRKAAEDGKGRDDFPSDLGQDARTAWREGWDARAAAKNAETAAQKPPVTGLRFDPKASPADAVAAHLAKGEGFSTIVQARKFIDENGGKGLSLKQVDEAIEHGVVKVARQIVASDPAPLAVYDKLVNLYNRQPRLGVRTSESVEQQAYSTPAPLAYIASRAAGIDATKTVYEPSAGNGMLLIGADPAKVKANELNGARAAVLRQQGFKVTQFDASKPGTARSAGTNDAVIANPPFGAVRDETGSVRRFDMSDIQRGYSTNEIDHVIALRSLGAMASDGRAVLILGSVAKTAQSPEARSDAYNGKAKREFFKTLYDGYNVVDHYTVSGDLYSRQGAAWPVDVVVIDGRGKSARRLPAADPPQIFDSWDQLKAKLDVQQLPDRRPSTPDAGEQPGEQTSGDGRGRPSGGDAGNRGGVGGLRRPVGGGEAERPAADVRPESDGEPIPVGGRGGADAETGGSLPADREPAGSRPVASPDRGDSADGLTPPAISPESRPEPTQAPAAPAPAAIDDGATQTPYKPRATGAESFDVLTPANMRDATHGALDGLAKRVGDLTDYTAKAVGMDRAALTRVLMAEQIDALALAIDNVERGSAFIIGDQTGIGKGRVNAMMIRYAITKGMTPIFVTEKPNLYGDMWRDLIDTKIEETLGRPPRILMTNSNERVTVEVVGQELVLKPLDGGGAAHNAALADIMSGSRAMDADAIFTTYSQMQSVKGGETVRRNFLRSVAPNSIVIFDESHNAGGQPKNDPRAQSAAKKKAEDRASLARWMAQAAKGVFFSSATFAKNPDVMDLYAKTDMRLAVKNVSELADVIRAGGVPLQEVISSMLARAGQYIRRERSFEGISYETPSVPFDRDAYNSFSRSLAAIHEFSKEVKESAKEIRSALKDQGNIISKDGAVGDSGVESTNFTSIMHNVINQMMLAAKADSAAEMAIAALRRGEKPVLTVSQTMESFLNHYAESAGVGIGMTLDGTFQDVLRRYLQRSREIRIKKGIGDAAEVEIHYLTNDELGPAGVAAFERAQEAIKNTDVGDLPLSPIDHIRARIEKAGFSVGEITGRDLSIDYSGNEPKLASRGATAKSTRARQRAIKNFNAGALDVIILNRAGSTGLSLHAGKMFGDKRQRHMMLIQPEENIDTHMQVLGRVNRSGQVVLPKYSQLSLDVPAERRPAAVLAKKMASLNAATTSSRKGALESNETVDFMNVYGDAVAANWITENWTEARYLDVGRDEDANGSTIEGAMRKLTGRLPLLDVDRQEAVYASLTDAYNALLNDKIAAGENALEAQFMPLDARPVDKVIAVAGTEGGSPFAEPAYAETINVKRLRPATNGAQAKEALAAAVDARPTDDMATIRAKADKWHSYTTRSAVMAFEQYRSEVIGNIKDEDAAKRARALSTEQLSVWSDAAQLFTPGSYVTIEDGLGQRTGLVLSFKRETRSAANPLLLSKWVAKVVTPGEGVESISVSRITPDKNGDVRTTVRRANHQSDADFMSLLDAMAKEGRQHRVVLTGNMLAAFARSDGKGQLIRYSTATGERAQGILLPQSFKSASDYVASQGKPITTVSGVIDSALSSPQQIIVSDDGAVSISQVQRGYKKQWVISVPISKEAGGKYFLNPNLRNSAGGFSSRGGKMVAELGIADSIEKSIEWIMQIGATFTSRPKKRDKD